MQAVFHAWMKPLQLPRHRPATSPASMAYTSRGSRPAAFGLQEQDLTPTMHLWNDYEGATLAGQWTLGRLLRTEGRSALFSTTKPDGAPAVLRLTEALNDQTALQARYRAMKAAGDEFLVKVEGFGDAEWDGAPLSYAVLEPTQESLADILANRRLDAGELQEVATVVAGGLLALHRQGLVHGLVEPESVLAAGDKIKLRSDCARPAPATPEDAQLEGALTEKTDAWGLADIIHRSLTQAPLQGEADALALPEPYAAIVRQTARGAWGVGEIEAELKRSNRTAAAPAAPAAKPAVPVEPAGPTSVPVAAANAPGSTSAGVAPSTPVHQEPLAKGAGVVKKQPIVYSDEAVNVRAASLPSAPGATPRDRILTGEELSAGKTNTAAPYASELARGPVSERGFQYGVSEDEKPVSTTRRTAIFAVIAAVLLIAILFAVFHHGAGPASHAGVVTQAPPGTAGAANPGVSSAAGMAGLPTQPLASGAAKPSPSEHSDVASAAERPSDGARDVWRVVAYTYHNQGKAERKAADLNKSHPSFKAEAWSPTGARPYLVTLGGPMPRAQAVEMRTLAIQAGVSKDVYAQNYAR